MTPAVKRAIKAADRLAHIAVERMAVGRSSAMTLMFICRDCRRSAYFRRVLVHAAACPVGRYLAARKEIADDV